MLTKKELEERKGFIGASEAAAVLGMSRWSTPLKVWSEKVGLIESDPNDNELPKWWGNEFEDKVAERFMKQTGKKVRRVKEAYVHKKYPFIQCHVDRIVEGEDAILQCKTASAFKAKEWEGDEDIPTEYCLQEYHELACTGRKKAYVAVAVGFHDFIIKEIVRDDKVIESMIQKEVYFWENFVIPKVMPVEIKRDDTDALLQLFPQAKPGTIIELDDEIDRIKESLEGLKKDEKSLEAEIEKLTNIVKARIKENEIGITNKWEIKWGNVHRDEYTVKATDYRTLRWKLLNK